MRTGLHFAALAKSPRLQRLLAYLQAQGDRGATTLDIVTGADVMAVNSAVSELRKNGYPVTCVFEGRNVRESSVFRYTLGAK